MREGYQKLAKSKSLSCQPFAFWKNCTVKFHICVWLYMYIYLFLKWSVMWYIRHLFLNFFFLNRYILLPISPFPKLKMRPPVSKLAQDQLTEWSVFKKTENNILRSKNHQRDALAAYIGFTSLVIDTGYSFSRMLKNYPSGHWSCTSLDMECLGLNFWEMRSGKISLE